MIVCIKLLVLKLHSYQIKKSMEKISVVVHTQIIFSFQQPVIFHQKRDFKNLMFLYGIREGKMFVCVIADIEYKNQFRMVVPIFNWITKMFELERIHLKLSLSVLQHWFCWV